MSIYYTTLQNAIRNMKVVDTDIQNIPQNILFITRLDYFDINDMDYEDSLVLYEIVEFIIKPLSLNYFNTIINSNPINFDKHIELGFLLARYLLDNFDIDFDLQNGWERLTIFELIKSLLVRINFCILDSSIDNSIDNSIDSNKYHILHFYEKIIIELLLMIKHKQMLCKYINPIKQTSLICLEHFEEYEKDLFVSVFDFVDNIYNEFNIEYVNNIVNESKLKANDTNSNLVI